MNCKVVNFKKKTWPKKLVTKVNDKIYILDLDRDISSITIRKWESLYKDSETGWSVVVRFSEKKYKVVLTSTHLTQLLNLEALVYGI